MKNTALLFLTALMLPLSGFSQTPSHAWVFGVDANLDKVEGLSIASDSNGGVYTVGYLSGTGDFNPGSGNATLSAIGTEDAFIQKLDKNGGYEWAYNFGSSGNYAKANAVKIDDQSNVFVIGYFEGSVDFKPGSGTSTLTSSGLKDAFILKLTADGAFTWAKSLSCTGDILPNDIDFDSDGNLYIVGEYEGSADFDPGADYNGSSSANPSYADGFLVKLDNDGNYFWHEDYGTTPPTRVNGIVISPANHLYITGSVQGSANFNPKGSSLFLSSNGTYDDIFVVKKDTGGLAQWGHVSGSGTTFDQGDKLTLDSRENVYVTGYFQDKVDFDPSTALADTFYLTSNGDVDVFVWKLDSSGNFKWANSFGSTSPDFGHSIDADPFGNIYLTGLYYGTVDFDPGTGTDIKTSEGYSDIYLQKLDTSGTMVWTYSIGDYAVDNGYALSVDDKANIYFTGSFNAIVDFDPGSGTDRLNMAGNQNLFVAKWSQCKYVEIDSSVTLSDDTVLTANASGLEYQWYQCGSGSPQVYLNGETGQTFTATDSGSYAVVITDAVCEVTSECMEVNIIQAMEEFLSPELEIYPNPSSGNFKIKLDNMIIGDAQISIYNLFGIEIYSKSILNNTKNEISLNLEGDISNGVYLLKIKAGTKTYMQKVIKE